MQPKDDYWHWMQLLPVKGGSVEFVLHDTDENDRPQRLTLGRPEILSGLKAMREKYKGHWNDVITENTDADTGDAFIQCCLFGEVIYG